MVGDQSVPCLNSALTPPQEAVSAGGQVPVGGWHPIGSDPIRSHSGFGSEMSAGQDIGIHRTMTTLPETCRAASIARMW